MNDKIKGVVFNYNLQMPCELYNKYIIRSNMYNRIIICFSARHNHVSKIKELYDYYIFLNCMDITEQNY